MTNSYAQLQREDPEPSFVLAPRDANEPLGVKRVIFDKSCYFVNFDAGKKKVTIPFSVFEQVSSLVEKKKDVTQRINELCNKSEKHKFFLLEKNKELDEKIESVQKKLEQQNQRLDQLERTLMKRHSVR